ncbi:relaxase/mobilization nuclease domain-containing protein [Allomuricauda sp. ARW1Y1]|jgi:hypothetical protein|uniref:relaxase/mobilization nuclease domain-containing protein n=1 Tax=Allomuricauda sp. ARW1Y1 TaxID=2663843 RepID=UPI0015C8D8B0|nr:relaxase/mobilization nuclease domain-containing protein [Muricauda sp. ARW1Y1]NYJ28207.1 hypothetical protein [Muricauda sp. ARW1Y1]
MIGNIIYGETCQGTLKYVFGKVGMRILGYGNMCSEDISTKFFGDVLFFQGQRNATKNRFAHISLSLPHGEHLDDAIFFKITKEYMQGMGYGEQPYVVVRHTDTKHEHVHIVTTNVKEDGKVLSIFNSYRRNIAAHQHLEKKYGLSPSPSTKQERELPIYRFPEYQFKPNDAQGTRFYIQDVLNGLLHKHKVRSFTELKHLAKPYHIMVKTITNDNGRVGVAYGIDNQKKYRTQFINGSVVHPKLSGPKLAAFFKKNSKSKLLPIHRKRLEKQLITTFKLFESIRHEDLPDVLKSYQNIDCELLYDKIGPVKELVIYDKSGYVFSGSEISSKKDFIQHPRLASDMTGDTSLDRNGKQFLLEIRKLIKNAFYESYLNSNKSNRLLSEFVLTKNLNDLLPNIVGSERYSFLNYYMGKESDENLLKVLKNEFEDTRKELHEVESRKEAKTLEERVSLFKKVLEMDVFNASENKSLQFYLLQGLGLNYADSEVSFGNSHSFSFAIGGYHIPKESKNYISTGSINQNVKVLEMLTGAEKGRGTDLSATSFFLPLLLPELYGSMNLGYQKQFEIHSLKAYLRTAEQFNIHLEKSPIDYINLFNAKGFYFENKEGVLHLSSHYSKNETGIPLSKKTQAYLKSSPDLDAVLANQMESVNILNSEGQLDLKNLWVSYLIERGFYNRAAYVMVHEGVRPNLHREALEYHMDKGLRISIHKLSNTKINAQQAAILLKTVYAFSSLLGGKYREKEAFNGFKDEFTDYSKRRNIFM